MYKVNLLDKLSFLFVIIGSINWGLYGLCNFNLVHYLFGFAPLLERIIYIIVFVSGLNLVALVFRSKMILKREQ
ncbi:MULTISPECIES: DUF378 domain-containing protein [Clostridium]|jgi:uncharacterized membrane protein YuzA (DUF378 family)|uniref:DUF378 domain-containing protein n=3 Tax=Clostridium intestinale TaxID=36845 RepID=U2Q2B2_9CLOT|nr:MULTISPECIES: DUF378 domain-containing protein [Clostridium]ERK30204.1 hypothetical protein CINTURNW_2084 [Clostridium intestinale URNW]QLY82044.1 DUF378 domain-containing protein [Clostridium intestinale]WRY53004.1 DUF378 domain-containing protein [Clostridium intestinale]SHH54556.1 hypothetical protein SAMN02745941_00322 [Clostridium intestinale DSM 6191]